MSITIYFGKVNLVSSQIGDALFNSISLRNILSELLNALRDNTSYTYTTTKQININETVTEDIEYSLSIKEKTDTDLQGYLHKIVFIL